MHHATLAALALAAPAAAQDTILTLAPTGNGNEWFLSAELVTAPSADGISSVWAEASFDLFSTDGDISNLTFNQGYVTSQFGPPSVSGEGTGTVEVRGATMPGGSLFAGPDNDNSNPLFVASFDYTGTAAALCLELVGQNSIAFVDNANPLFGAVEFYQDANGNPGERIMEIFCIPAPSSAALLSLAGLAATRRRREETPPSPRFAGIPGPPM